MNNNIYSRPMFQNPQQRAGGGIMAGVAPIQMNNGGDPGMGEMIWDEVSKPTFWFDRNDPIDQASLALALVPGVNFIARLTAMGLKGAKLYKQINKIEKFRDATNKAAAISGTTSAALQAGDFGYDIKDEVGALAEVVPEWAEAEYNNFRTKAPPPTVYDQTVPSYGDAYIDDIESAASGNFTSSPQYDEGGISSLVPDQNAVSGGISDVARSIAEARKIKSSTFKRGDKDLAAVTAEDLEESGFDSLKDYLNNMEFNLDSGRYEPEGMANGGIMRLKDGSDEEGVVAEEFVDEYQDFFDAYENLDPEKFMNLIDEDPEKAQVYIDDYQKKLQFKEDLRSRDARNPIAYPPAIVGDILNYIPEKATELYRDFRYGDKGKAMGLSEPFDERPTGEEWYGIDVEDPTFYEELTTPRNTKGPSIADILGSRPTPPEPLAQEDTSEETEIIDKPIQEEKEERPGFIESAYGALKSFYDVGDTDLEKRASRAARGRRKYGTSYQQAYNDELLKLQLGEAKVKEYESVSNSRGRSELQQGMEYIAEQFPKYKDDPGMLFSLFRSLKSNSGTLTEQDVEKNYQAILKVLIEDKDGEQTATWEAERKSDPSTENNFDEWAMNRAASLSGKTLNETSAPSVPSSWGEAEKVEGT